MVGDPTQLGIKVFDYSGGKNVAVGSLDPYYEIDEESNEQIILINPKKPDPIFFDLTHDNLSYNQKRTAMDSLSTAGVVS